LRFLYAAVKERDYTQIVGWTCGFIASLKEIDHEALHTLRSGRFG
jgi:hypothetical protein